MMSSIVARGSVVVLGVTVLLTLSGCSLLFGGRPEPTPTQVVERRLVPTFTPTPEQSVAQLPAEQALPPVEQATLVVVDAAPPTPAPQPETVETPTEEPPTATPSPKLTVNLATANTRMGPGTNYGLAGTVSQGQSFNVIGKSPDGTWWQICCVNGQQVWIFGDLVAAENVGSVPVAQNIPAPPPVVVAPTATPVPPPAAPEPAAPPPAQAGAVHAGPCGGDDGCKFRIRRGPSKANNGGGELKMQLFFIHSGVDGGQPQGDYRLGIEKDGQLLTTFADTRSIVFARNEGPMGPFNYEGKLNASSLPGGNVAGTYFFWVLDGNRERDSEVFRLDLGPGEGEVWIEFDQG